MDLAKYGPWALIIGGSEGVGASFARQLAFARVSGDDEASWNRDREAGQIIKWRER